MYCTTLSGIWCRGLRMETVIMNLMKVYCDPGNLILVLGTTPREEELFVTELQKQAVTPLPRVLSSENSNTDRSAAQSDLSLLQNVKLIHLCSSVKVVLWFNQPNFYSMFTQWISPLLKKSYIFLSLFIVVYLNSTWFYIFKYSLKTSMIFFTSRQATIFLLPPF